MWKRAEYKCGITQRRVLGREESDFAVPDTHALTALAVSSRKPQLELRMTFEQLAEFTAGIAACAQDTDRNFMHTECITLQSGSVNRGARLCLVRLSSERLEPPHYTIAGQP